jgi:hypothetical protein
VADELVSWPKIVFWVLLCNTLAGSTIVQRSAMGLRHRRLRLLLLTVMGTFAAIRRRGSVDFVDCAEHFRLLRQRRAAGKLGQRGVADVFQIFDADLAGVKPVAGHGAQFREKQHSLAEHRIGLRVFLIGNEV